MQNVIGYLAQAVYWKTLNEGSANYIEEDPCLCCCAFPMAVGQVLITDVVGSEKVQRLSGSMVTVGLLMAGLALTPWNVPVVPIIGLGLVGAGILTSMASLCGNLADVWFYGEIPNMSLFLFEWRFLFCLTGCAEMYLLHKPWSESKEIRDCAGCIDTWSHCSYSPFCNWRLVYFLNSCLENPPAVGGLCLEDTMKDSLTVKNGQWGLMPYLTPTIKVFGYGFYNFAMGAVFPVGRQFFDAAELVLMPNYLRERLSEGFYYRVWPECYEDPSPKPLLATLIPDVRECREGVIEWVLSPVLTPIEILWKKLNDCLQKPKKRPLSSYRIGTSYGASTVVRSGQFDGSIN